MKVAILYTPRLPSENRSLPDDTFEEYDSVDGKGSEVLGEKLR
jgi:hypothetical protein